MYKVIGPVNWNKWTKLVLEGKADLKVVYIRIYITEGWINQILFIHQTLITIIIKKRIDKHWRKQIECTIENSSKPIETQQ